MMFAKAVAIALCAIAWAPASAQKTSDECKKCKDCIFPISEKVCRECCKYKDVEIQSADGNTITAKAVPTTPQTQPQTFKVTPTTKRVGEAKKGERATIYYHNAEQEPVATEVQVLNAIPENDLLLPGNEETHDCNSVPETATVVIAGKLGFVALSYPYVPIYSRSAGALMSIQRTQTGILVTVPFYDAKGELTAEVVNNQIFGNYNKEFTTERPNSHSFSILDGPKNLLTFDYVNPRTLRIMGTWYTKDGHQIDMTPDATTFDGKSLNGGFTVSGICIAGGSIGMRIN